MRYNRKRGLAFLLAVLLLCCVLSPGAAATSSVPSSITTNSTLLESPEPGATPNANPQPEATPKPLPSQSPAANAEPGTEVPPAATAEPETTAGPSPTADPQESASPEATASPQPEASPIPVEITDMFTTAEAKPGDTVDLYVKLNQDAGARYQWQRLYTPPLDEEATAEALYPYGEGESTDYYFPLEGTSEAEVLAQNPDAVWPGIEIYYDQLARQPMLMDENATVPEIHIENGTHNYVLDPVATFADEEDIAPTGEWADLPGETSSVYRHEVTTEDAYSSYRCVVTVEPLALEEIPELETSAIPEESGTPAAAESPVNEVLAAGDKLPAEPPESVPAANQMPETASETLTLISDSMYLSLSGQTDPEPEAAPRLFSSRAAAPAVALSDDHQWLTGVTKEMEYITQDTYNAQGCEAAGSAYWTRISGGTRPDGSQYKRTALTNQKIEVLSAWYGRTVYVRYQGQSGPGTVIEIPAYTGIDYQTGASTLYKNAIKVINAWVPDTGGSFYSVYLNVALKGGNTPNGGHITIDSVSLLDFNKYSSWYLTNAEGDYIYDAVIIGAATNDEPDLSGAAAWELAHYIGEGYGFLIGHDMLYGYGGVAAHPDYTPDPNSTVTPYYRANTLQDGHYNMAWLMGQNARYTDVSPYTAPSMILCGGDYRDKSTLYGDDSGLSKLRILKSSTGDPIADVSARVPTTYPFSSFYDGKPFKVNDTLDGTATHTNQQVAYGTVWINYASNGLADRGLGRLITDQKSDGLTGTNNFYLTSNGNLAMSQIGHKKGNKDIVKIDECYILANTMFYISQRQQCQVCQSRQGGNDNVHFVRRISSAEELAKLNDQEKYWFTYPIDGCYILTTDIHLAADWQPIQGFTGHFDADGHDVTFSSSLPAERRTVFAPADAGGWNLGTDKTQGVLQVYQGDTRSTGVARVVGYISALGIDADTLEGYTVEIAGSDGTAYTCQTNKDGKYVLSNLPCTGVMVATLYDPAGRKMNELGQLAVTVPDGTGMVTLEGRSQDFWQSSETTAIYPLDYLALPPEPATRWVSESADFTATILTSTEYPADKIIWQYKTKNGDWADLDGSDVEYQVTHLGQVDTGDPLTTGTQTRLTLQNLPLALDGTEVRIRYEGNRGVPKTSGSAAVTVRTPELTLDMSAEQTVFVKYQDTAGNRLNHAVPADRWPALFGETYPAEYAALNNGSNLAEYTSTILYRPELGERSTPVIQWLYRTGNNTTTETALGSSQYNAAAQTWSTSLDYSALKALYPQLVFSVANNAPVACTEDGTPDPAGEWRRVTSTLTVDGASTAMDVGNTHFFFRCAASNEYGSDRSLYQGKATSADAGLSVQYPLDILPGEGAPVYGSGYADWTFPQLQVFAPNGLRTAIVTFYQPGHNGNDKITVTAGNPYGITVDAVANDYVVFKSTSGNLIPQETWQEFFRGYLTFRSYDPKDNAVEDVSWYIAEEDEGDKFKVMLFDGSTSGWSANTTKTSPRPYYGYGAPQSWSGYNETVRLAGFTGGGQLTATTTSSSDSRGYSGAVGCNYYNIRGWDATLSKSFNATNLAKLYLDAYVSAPSSSVISNSIRVGNLTISAPASGKEQTTTGGPKLYDISALTGNVDLALRSTVITYYALDGGERPNSEFIGRTETTQLVVRQAYALANNFERTNRSAVRYSELWAKAVKTTATVTLTADPEKVYDGQPSKATLTVTAVDGNGAYILNSATLTYTKGGQLVSTGKPGDASGCIDQGAYTAMAAFPQDVLDRYDLQGLAADGTITAAIKITPRPLTLRSKYMDDPDHPANIKMYDGTTTAAIGNIKVANIVPGDLVALDKSSYGGTYATGAAGEQLTPDGKVLPDRYKMLAETLITRTEEIHLVNDPKGNYYIASEDYSGAIYRRPMTAFVGAFTSTYGEDPQLDPKTAAVYSADEGGDGTDLELSALVGSDTLAIDAAKSRFVLPAVDASSPAGVYEVAYEGLTESNYPVLTNYILWQQPGLLTIGPRPLIIRAGDYTKVYGDPLPVFVPGYSGFVNGDTPEAALEGTAVFTCEAATDSDVGNYPVELAGLTCRQNDLGAYNYKVSLLPGTLEITRRPIIITPDGPDGPDEPDGPQPDEVRAVTVVKAADKAALAVGDTVTYTLTVSNIGTVELTDLPVRDTHDGAGSIQAADGPGYTYADGVFTVLRLPVGKSITITYRYTALQADAGKVLTNIAVATVPGANPEDPDHPGQGLDPEKPIDPDKEVPSNEVEVPVDPDKAPEPPPEPEQGRSLQVTKTADLAFARPGDTITYTLTATNTGTEDLAGVTVRDKPLNFAGTPVAVPGDGYTCQGNVCTIPTLPAGGSVTLTYTYLVLEADAGKNLRNLAVATLPGTNPPDPDDPDNGTDPTLPIDPDKEVPSGEVVVPVDPAGGLAADPQIKVYGDPDPELTYTLPEGLVKPGDIWGELERVPGEDVGTYTILQGTVQSKNYDITYVPNYLIIVPAPLTITAEDKQRPAYTANPPFTVIYEGFKFNDGPEDLKGELEITCPAELESEPGAYPITPSGLAGHNYSITYVPGTLTIWDAAVPLDYGYIEVYQPGSDAKYGSSVTKEFPQTGGGAVSDSTEDLPAGALLRTWSGSTAHAPFFLWEDGRFYVRQRQETRQTPAITETRLFDDLQEPDVPASVTVERDGITYTLALESADYQGVTGHLQVEGTVDHGYQIQEPGAPSEKEITYADPDTGMILTITGTLADTEQTEPYDWREVEFPLRYYGDESFTIFQLDDTFLPYDTNAPYWQETDALVMRHLELPTDSYRLTGSAWLSGWELDTRGLPVRYGTLAGEMYGARWVSRYTAQTDIPLYAATAVYSNEAEAGTDTITAQYLALPLALVVGGALFGVLLILALVIVVLFLLKRKRKEVPENAECDPGN